MQVDSSEAAEPASGASSTSIEYPDPDDDGMDTASAASSPFLEDPGEDE